MRRLGRFEEAANSAERAKVMVEQKLGRKLEEAGSFQQFLAIAPPHLTSRIQKARERIAELRSS